MNLDEKIPGCQYFTWKEALWLNRWNRAAIESDGFTDTVRRNLENTFRWMDKIRQWIDKPIKVHVAFRPTPYNKEVGGATQSAHLDGRAVDFSISGMTCDEFKRQADEDNKLEEFGLRMEDNGNGASWIHLDDKTPGVSGRFFKP
jgi:uncharacterized protein YcbK (DUF882 family)